MTTKPIITTLLLSLILLFAIGLVRAQDSEEVRPPAENNIICFAAKKQWVCASADEQHKAQEKAKKLALEPDKSELIDDGVEIQTLQPVNIGQKARDSSPNEVVPYAVQDFTPRDDALQENNEVEQQVDSQTSENVTQNTVEVEVPSEPERVDTPTQEKVINDVPVFNTAPNDFTYWQTHFSEQWTFQVVGTSNRHHLADFINRNGLQNLNHTIVRTQRDGADWWIVLVGLYSSRDEAKSEQYSLPSSIANAAWVRQIKTIEGQAD